MNFIVSHLISLFSLVIQVLDGTDHINSCKPVNRTDPSYAETLDFLKKLKAHLR